MLVVSYFNQFFGVGSYKKTIKELFWALLKKSASASLLVHGQKLAKQWTSSGQTVDKQ